MRLPLYLPDKPLAQGGFQIAVEHERPLTETNPACRRCSLWEGAKTVCMAVQADGPGGVLFVGEKPGKDEDAVGVPNVGATGSYLRDAVARHNVQKMPTAYTNAVLCAPGAREVTPKMVSACRGYLAGVVAELKPKRIVCLGSVAAEAVLGRSVPPLSVRRGHAFTAGGIPVFLLLHNAAAVRNSLIKRAFEKDLAWALGEIPFPMFGGNAKATCSLVSSPAEAEAARDDLRKTESFSYDCEWVGKPYGRDGFALTNVSCTQVAPEGDEHVWVWDALALADPALSGPLRDLMADKDVGKSGSNLPVDVHAIEQGLGVRVRGELSDVRLKRKLIEADADADLEVMAELVGMGGHKEEADAECVRIADEVRAEVAMRAKEAASGQRRMFGQHRLYDHVPPRVEELALGLAATKGVEYKAFSLPLLPKDVMARYNGRDALATSRLETWCEWRFVKDAQIHAVWKDLVQPALRAVIRVEDWGVYIDKDAVIMVQQHLTQKLAEVDARLAVYVRDQPGFNWDSNPQVGNLLYTKLGLPCSKLTKDNKQSVDEEALDGIRGKHPAVDDLIEHRRLTKMKGTYADGMLRAIGADGRVHGYILLDGAGTGRTSMQDPNFQNVPRAGKPPGGTYEGTLIRQCVTAPHGYVLVEFDYGTLEPRCGAILSGDPVLKAVFTEGRDFHGETAAIVKPFLHPNDPAVTKETRQEAKPIGLGVFYGKGAMSMAETLGCAKRVAQGIIDAILGKYRVLARWIQDSINSAMKTGYMETWWNGKPARRRPLWGIGSQDQGQRGNAERGSYNGRIQGTASDFLIASLAEVVRVIEEEALPAKVVLPIHDSLLMEVRVEDVAEVVDEVRRVMVSHESAGVPLVVDVKVGNNWGSMMDLAKWEASVRPPVHSGQNAASGATR